MAKRATWLSTLRRAPPGLAASDLRWRSVGLRLFMCLLACVMGLVTTAPVYAASKQMKKVGAAGFGDNDLETLLQTPSVESTDPMLLQADELIYDNENNRVMAKGDVEIYYGDYTLLADEVIYDRNSNTLAARGNVRIKDPDGAVITSNQMTLTDDFRDGFINALKLVTQDDTRIGAATATREAGNVTVFHNGWFTPCKPCEDHPSKAPTWRIRSSKITHKKDQATITFNNAFFEFLGVPIIWVPYFQMADPTVKRKSGFLMPSYSHSDRLGNTATVPYYFALADNYDFTFAPMYTEDAGILLQGVWRHRLSSGGYSVELAGVWDQGTFDSPTNGDFRGSIKTKGKFALNPYWALGWDALIETDDTFRRFYNIDSELRTDRVSQLYLEGLHDRNYFAARLYQTGSLLVTDSPDSQAAVLPLIDYDYIVSRPIMGGELSFNSNVMSLTSNDGPDSSRLIVQSKWRRQFIDGMGQVYTPFAQLRGDIYEINDYVPPGTTMEENGGKLRGNAIAGAEYRYPFIATTGSVAHVFEPIAQIIVRPDSVGDQEDIPNEDALSLVFDDTILFQIDKFSGYDRIETGTRANVGVRYTAQLNSGAYARAVFGESFQLAGRNEFDEQSGLGTDRSDYVGGLYLQATSNLAFSAQTRFDHDTLDIERTDLGSWAKYGPVEVAVNYADVVWQPGLADGEPREEVLTTGALALTDVWSLLGKIRYDIDQEISITQALGLQYADDCFRLSVVYQETNIRDRDIEPEQRILVKFALKYLGSYGTGTDDLGELTPSSEAGQ